ncbi:zinc finger CCCH domain-containing protein 19-like [Forsythia ovata]|uniref:Zinc finger CCCH domain-containing protein 19-like n=1 Tax=Forsythia ovata TaxID=205694 RepID=A0ABD1VK16_9LAMI
MFTLRECVEKLQLLKTPDERRRRLEEIPEIHADPKMDPSYESDDDGSETDESPRDAYTGSRGSVFSRRERGPISPRSDYSAVESWSGAEINSTKNWELSRNLSAKNISTDAIQIVDKVNENSWNQGRDRETCTQESNNFEKPSLTTNFESVERNVRSVSGSEPVSAVSSLTSPAPLSARVAETSAVKINEMEKMWLYQDPSGKVQGPFSIVQLRKWSNTGYFPAELRIWRTAEKQEDSILLADALAGKCQKELPELGNKLHNPHISSDSAKTLETSLHQVMKRSNAAQKPVQNPNLSTEKSFGNDSLNLPSPTPKRSNGGQTGGEGGPLPGETQHPPVNAVLKPPAAALPQLRTDSSASSSVPSSVAASSPAPKPEQGGPKSGDFRQTPPMSTVTSEPHAVKMHGHLPSIQNMTVQPVQSVISQDRQVETRGSGSDPSQKVEPSASIPQSGQHQAYGWGGVGSTVQNFAGNSSNSGITVIPQPDFWRPLPSGLQSNMQPPGMANAPWAENPNPGWGTMQANPNSGWGTQAPGSMNMNWVPVQVQPTGNATSDWAVPAGNSGATVQGPASGNVHPGWVATPSWGAPNGNTGSAVRLQGPGPVVPGWCPPAGIGAPVQGPPVGMGAPVQGPPPGIGAPVQAPPPGVGAPVQGPPPSGVGAPVQGLPTGIGAPLQGPPTGIGGPLQGPPQGNTNQGWGAPAGGQGMWGGQQNPNGGPFSGGFGGGRPWNGQSSFGRGGPRPFNRREKVCPYNGNGRCRKGVRNRREIIMAYEAANVEAVEDNTRDATEDLG